MIVLKTSKIAKATQEVCQQNMIPSPKYEEAAKLGHEDGGRVEKDKEEEGERDDDDDDPGSM